MDLANMAPEDIAEAAPIFDLSSRKIVAIEHPCVVRDLDKGIDVFGPNPEFHTLLHNGPERKSLPLWFRRDNPTTKPIVSQHASSNGILLKITVPKRTGRKRKRGSDEPFSGDVTTVNGAAGDGAVNQVASVGRRDKPEIILRKMQDNIGKYHVEAVGSVTDTHRYRGLADFQFTTTNAPFLTKVADHLLPLDLSTMRGFKLRPGVDSSRNQEFIPPPHYTDKILSFNYNYEQNPYIRVQGKDEDGETTLVNTQGRKKMSYGWFIRHDKFPAPSGPKKMHDQSHESLNRLVGKLRRAMDERPIWTRRGLMNHMGGEFLESQLRIAIQVVGYQFKGGPWRDAIIKYGVDPRLDPSCHIYQTLSFKLTKNKVGKMNVSWQTIRKGQMMAYSEKNRERNYNSHLWDGESYTTDGKFWQLCDVTDPYLMNMIKQAPVRPECDLVDSGWFYKGFWGKVKLFMKTKMLAIKYGRVGSDEDPERKPGYIYNSELAHKLSHIRDDSDEKAVMNMHPLTYPMRDLLEEKRVRRRPTRLSEPYPGPAQKRREKKQKAAKANTEAEEVGSNKSDTVETPANPDVRDPADRERGEIEEEEGSSGSDGAEFDEVDDDAGSGGDGWDDDAEGEDGADEEEEDQDRDVDEDENEDEDEYQDQDGDEEMGEEDEEDEEDGEGEGEGDYAAGGFYDDVYPEGNGVEDDKDVGAVLDSSRQLDAK